MTARTRATRAGFTLVEVLMVIAIISILAALLFVALSGASKTAKKVQVRNDLSQLETVLTSFKKDFGFYPPSHVTLSTGVARFMVPTHAIPNSLSGLPKEQNDRSFEVLQRMFPRWSPTVDASGQIIDGGTAAAYKALTGNLAGNPLDPNQSLLYFLGGPSLSGFETARPYVPTGTTKKGPYFDFPANRVVTINAADPNVGGYASGNGLPNFVDLWGVPYAYFAASGDAYDSRLMFPLSLNLSPYFNDLQGDKGMRPFRTGNKWVNPGKCQLVSAGPDRKFGLGSQSLNTTSGVYYLPGPPARTSDWLAGRSFDAIIDSSLTRGYAEKEDGADDIANFNEGGDLGVSSAP